MSNNHQWFWFLLRFCPSSSTRWWEGSFTLRLVASMLLCKSHTLSSVCNHKSKQAKITKSPLLPLQIPVLPVRQSDRHAVSGQCCVCSSAAAPVFGHDGTPEWRPVLGMHTQFYPFRNTWEHPLILVLPSRSTLDCSLSVCWASCCLSTSSTTERHWRRSKRKEKKMLRSTSKSMVPIFPRPTCREEMTRMLP